MNKNLLMALWHANSRKVAFGLLLFGTTTALLVTKFLTSDQWMLCMASCTALIGGGTVADALLKKNAPTSPAVVPAP